MKHGGDIYNNHIELDLSVNRNPIALPMAVRDSITEAVSLIGNYPEYDQKRLRQALSRLDGCRPEEIICGNGASDIFMGIIHAFCPKKALLVCPGFYGYEYVLEACKCEISYYELKEENGFILQHDYLDYIDENLDMIILGNPNNPTGRFIDNGLLTGILEKAKAFGIKVVLDECFYLLGKKTGKYSPSKVIKEYPEVIVVRAFTKVFAIPGIRIGYAYCNEKAADQIRVHLGEWNISIFADEVGRACCDVLMNTDFLTYSLDMLDIAKQYLWSGLLSAGIKVFESDVNFLLIKAFDSLGKELLKKGILIRDCREYRGLGPGFYRVSVQDKKSTDILLDAIKSVKGY